MWRVTRLKDSSRRWAKAKTACLQHLRVTEKGLQSYPMISVHWCTHTGVKAALLSGDLAVVSTAGVRGPLFPRNWVTIGKSREERKMERWPRGSVLFTCPPLFIHACCTWLKFHTAEMGLHFKPPFVLLSIIVFALSWVRGFRYLLLHLSHLHDWVMYTSAAVRGLNIVRSYWHVFLHSLLSSQSASQFHTVWANSDCKNRITEKQWEKK